MEYKYCVALFIITILILSFVSFEFLGVSVFNRHGNVTHVANTISHQRPKLDKHPTTYNSILEDDTFDYYDTLEFLEDTYDLTTDIFNGGTEDYCFNMQQYLHFIRAEIHRLKAARGMCQGRDNSESSVSNALSAKLRTTKWRKQIVMTKINMCKKALPKRERIKLGCYVACSIILSFVFWVNANMYRICKILWIYAYIAMNYHCIVRFLKKVKPSLSVLEAYAIKRKNPYTGLIRMIRDTSFDTLKELESFKKQINYIRKEIGCNKERLRHDMVCSYKLQNVNLSAKRDEYHRCRQRLEMNLQQHRFLDEHLDFQVLHIDGNCEVHVYEGQCTKVFTVQSANEPCKTVPRIMSYLHYRDEMDIIIKGIKNNISILEKSIKRLDDYEKTCTTLKTILEGHIRALHFDNDGATLFELDRQLQNHVSLISDNRKLLRDRTDDLKLKLATFEDSLKLKAVLYDYWGIQRLKRDIWEEEESIHSLIENHTVPENVFVPNISYVLNEYKVKYGDDADDNVIKREWNIKEMIMKYDVMLSRLKKRELEIRLYIDMITERQGIAIMKLLR